MLLRLLHKLILVTLVTTLGAAVSAGQIPEKTPPAPGVQDFPVVLEQAVKAGKTPVGTKVSARLLAATLVNGKVIPRNAIFSGEVIASTAKSDSSPCHLSILLNSVAWKNGSADIKAYVSSWYYPAMAQSGPNLQYGPGGSAARNWNYGAGEYPNPNSPSYKPFPDADSGKDPGVPDTTSSVTSKNRVAMKDVEIQYDSDDRVVLISKRSNITLDRLTAYDAISKSVSFR